VADTSKAHKLAEQLVIATQLPKFFCQKFSPKKVKLKWGGYFAYDGVSEDGRIVVCVSTSEGVTTTGKYANAKVMKLAKDVLMMLFTPSAKIRVLALTEKSMVDAVRKMQVAGRFPPESAIRVVHTPVPKKLRTELEKVRARARADLVPKRRNTKIRNQLF
jgi:hypothetical protein